MKTLNTYIEERLVLSKNKTREYTERPADNEDLRKLVRDTMNAEGNKCSLNHIDVSHITNFSMIFKNLAFDGDISEWDVSNATNMERMFEQSSFTGRNSDLTGWDVSKVENMYKMFSHSPFNGDISTWNLNSAKDIYGMFMYSTFDGRNGNIDNWDVSNVTEYGDVFKDSPLENNPPKWYRK
jgi:hypothetical protein